MNSMPSSTLERIRRYLVGLRMPRALEALDATMKRFEQGDSSMMEVLETLLGEEFTTRETRRIKMALQTARLGTIKTLAGYDFSFQPSLDRDRIMALAQLEFIERRQTVHFLGPPGTGKITSVQCAERGNHTRWQERLLRLAGRDRQLDGQGRTGRQPGAARAFPRS